MNNPYSGWYVLYVKPQHEKKVDLLLKESELDSFLPTVVAVRQWKDRKKKVIMPLFPSYVFLNVSSKNGFHKALKINGVYKFLRFGEEYARIRNEEINRIKQFLKLDGISEVDSTTAVPFKGEIMTINYGPMSGLKCEILQANNMNRVFVRIESIRQNIVAKIPAAYLTKNQCNI